MNIGGRYNKFVIAIVTAVIGWATMVVQSPHGSVTSAEWIAGGTYLAIALGVFTVANHPTP
jgi:uncharacterized membrane protein